MERFTANMADPHRSAIVRAFASLPGDVFDVVTARIAQQAVSFPQSDDSRACLDRLMEKCREYLKSPD